MAWALFASRNKKAKKQGLQNPAMTRLFLSSYAFTIIGVGLGFISHFALANLLDADGYGRYSFIFSTSFVLCMIAMFGFQASTVRLIPIYELDKNEHKLISALIKFSYKFATVLSLLAGTVVFGLLYAFGYAEKYTLPLLSFLFILPLLQALFYLNSGLFKAFHKAIASVLYEGIYREALMLLLIGIFLISPIGFDNAFIALTTLCTVLVLLVLSSLFHNRKFIPKTESYTPTPSEFRAQKLEWLKVSFPMMMLMVFKRLMRRIDIIILGLMVEPELVGIYALMTMLADGCAIATKPALTIFAPKAAQLFKQNKKAELKKLYNQTLWQIAGMTMLTSIIAAVLGPYIIPYFGDVYMNGYNTLLILLIGNLMTILMGPAIPLLNMAIYEKEAMKFTAIAAFLNIALNPFFIYYFSIEGAALVTAFVFILQHAMGVMFIRRHKILEQGS